MNFDDMSLEELIASQERDLRRGHFTEQQPHTVYLSKITSSGAELGDVLLSNEGMMFKKRWRGSGCTIHGLEYMGGNASPKCRACEKDRRDLKRRLSGKERRKPAERDENGIAYAPPCKHENRRLAVIRDEYPRYRCMECDKERKRAYYHENKEKILAQKKAKAAAYRARGLTSRGTRPKLPPGVRVVGWIND